jgi:hypothetical protein
MKYIIDINEIRHGYNQKVKCKLITPEIGYQLIGFKYCVDVNGNPISDIQEIHFNVVSGPQDTADLESTMGDPTKTVAENVADLVEYYVLKLVSEGQI